MPIRHGKNGCIAEDKKREGDGKTPLGRYILRFGLYRADRLPSPAQLAKHAQPLTYHILQASDGWCDTPDHALYNRFVKSPPNNPFRASHERLWRDDHVYDIILVLSHNDAPPRPNLGSAIFIHLARADEQLTEGCIALAPENMVKLLPYLKAGMEIDII